MTVRPLKGGAPIPALWMDDPDDHLSHAWRYVLDGGNWRALCGRVADPATLTMPEDEFGRHDECLLKLGAETADRHDDIRAEMRRDMLCNGM